MPHRYPLGTRFPLDRLWDHGEAETELDYGSEGPGVSLRLSLGQGSSAETKNQENAGDEDSQKPFVVPSNASLKVRCFYITCLFLEVE